MPSLRRKHALTHSFEQALDAPWRHLEYLGRAEDLDVRAQELDRIEDGGRAEDRVRHDYTGRYPFELLQNAHDACADAGRAGAVRFVVTGSALLVANDGEPFTPKRIRSLVRLGSSEKARRRRARRTIGYKGVGFTAVFEITDCPQIVSRDVSFMFDGARARREVAATLKSPPANVPARAFPFRISVDDCGEDAGTVAALLADGAATVVRLPLRETRTTEEVAAHVLETIPPEALIFLPFANELVLDLAGRRESWRRTTGRAVGAGRLVHLTRDAGRSRQSWLVASSTIRVGRAAIEALEDPLWTGLRELEAAVALPWNRRPDPARGPQRLHVYFPTDDMLGRPLLLHGDFYVDSSRRHIEALGPGGVISRSVAAAAAKLTADLAESVADHGRPLLECLADADTPSGFGREIGTLLDEALRRARIARPADGTAARRPDQLRGLALKTVALERALLPLLGRTRDLLAPDDYGGPAGALLERLGTEWLKAAEVAARIDLSTGVVDYAPGLRAVARFLAQAPADQRKDVVTALRDRPLMRDVAGVWRVPEELALRVASAPALPRRLQRTEVALPDGAEYRRLARVLEIAELTTESALDIVVDAVRGGFGERPADAREVHTFMREAWARDRKAVERPQRKLGRIRVPARAARGGRTEWRRADAVYFPARWSDDPTAEALYARFGEAEFLVAPVPANGAAARDESSFYATLGVAGAPRMHRRSGDAGLRSWRAPLRHYGAWRELDEVGGAFRCEMNHTQTPWRVSVTTLDRLDELLDDGGREARTRLARYLSSQAVPMGPDAEVQCQGASHWSRAPRNRTIGYQRWRLATAAWIAVRNDPAGREFRPPGEAWSGARLPPWLMVPQARPRPEDVRRLGLIQADRPGAPAVAAALRELRAHFPDLAAARVDVQRTAQWLAKRLDRAQQRAHAAGELPPVPTRIAGAPAWSTAPVVPDLPDLDAFTELALLEPGAWRGLRRTYGVRRASDVLSSELEVGDRVSAPRVLGRDDQAGLAAVLLSQGAEEERVATRLARLREVAVNFVQLRFRIDGGAPTGPHARPFHLAMRRDRAGRVTGASLYVRHPLHQAARIALGRDLAQYLELPEHLHTAVSLFLTSPDALIESEHIGDDEVAQARRRVERHRRGRDGGGDDGFADLLDESLPGGDSDGDAPDDADAAAPDGERSGGDRREGADGDSGGTGEGDGSRPEPAPHDPPAPSPLPSIEADAVVAVDVPADAPPVAPPGSRDTRRSGGSVGSSGGSSGGGTDWAALERDRRLYGRRGEEVAYEQERRRLAGRGWDPGVVRWIARKDELSPYDIESVDARGGVRYIEVKSTTGDDPSEPFQISTAELRFAIRNRSRYEIHRVTDVRSSAPRIYRYDDPVGDLECARGYLQANRALMALPGRPTS